MIKKTKSLNGFCIATCLFTASNVSALNTETSSNDVNVNVAKLVDQYTPAQVNNRVPPKFPRFAAARGQEGWVQVSFVIDTDGSVIEPKVINSAGHHTFEREALKAVEQWQYSPAMQDGTPIQQCENKVQIDFNLHGAGVSRKFQSFYKKGVALLQERKLDELNELLENADWDESGRMDELVYFHYLKSEYYGETKDWPAQLKHLLKVIPNPRSAHKYDRFSKDFNLRNMQSLLNANLNQGHYQYALDTFEGIKRFETDLSNKIVTAFQPYIDQVLELKENETTIVKDAYIGTGELWSHKLLKNGFAISDIEGQLNKLDVRCSKKRSIFTVKEDNHWQIPKSWGDCSVLIEGKSGTNFKLIEHNQQDS